MQSQSPITLDAKLNIVIPVDGTARGTVYVHSTPISREVYRKYFEELTRTFGLITRSGDLTMIGPASAALYLEKAATALGTWDSRDGVRDGLIAEIHRLTNIKAVNGKGWEVIPYYEAQGILSDDDRAEIEDILCFFTLCSSVLHRPQRGPILRITAGLWGAQLTSLSCTEFDASSQGSTPAGSTEGTASSPTS